MLGPNKARRNRLPKVFFYPTTILLWGVHQIQILYVYKYTSYTNTVPKQDWWNTFSMMPMWWHICSHQGILSLVFFRFCTFWHLSCDAAPASVQFWFGPGPGNHIFASSCNSGLAGCILQENRKKSKTQFSANLKMIHAQPWYMEPPWWRCRRWAGIELYMSFVFFLMCTDVMRKHWNSQQCMSIHGN